MRDFEELRVDWGEGDLFCYTLMRSLSHKIESLKQGITNITRVIFFQHAKVDILEISGSGLSPLVSSKNTCTIEAILF